MERQKLPIIIIIITRVFTGSYVAKALINLFCQIRAQLQPAVGATNRELQLQICDAAKCKLAAADPSFTCKRTLNLHQQLRFSGFKYGFAAPK